MHVGKRLLRHPGRRARVEGRAGALPGHLRGRGVQPARRRRGGHRDRQREPGQSAQLAFADLPDRRRQLVRHRRGHRAVAPADARSSRRGADPGGSLPRRRRPDELTDATTVRGDAPAPRRRPRDDDRRRGLVGDDRVPLDAGRQRDELAGRALPGPGQRASRVGGDTRTLERFGPADRADHPVPHPRRHGRAKHRVARRRTRPGDLSAVRRGRRNRSRHRGAAVGRRDGDGREGGDRLHGARRRDVRTRCRRAALARADSAGSPICSTGT